MDTDQFTSHRGSRLKEDLETAFGPFCLDEVLKHAEHLENSFNVLSLDDYQAWLSAAFATLLPARDREATLEALRDLEQSGALLVTTNYDSLLSQVTGLPPITWEQHDDFFRVMDRQHRGILHMHGHWKRPNSVILGRRSYDRIKGDTNFQDLLKVLWLHNTWIYVGCGDGMDDPNLGNLLTWAEHWEKSAREDYFLSRGAATAGTSKPENLVYHGYTDHAVDLPRILHALEPGARAFPFTLLDGNFRLFRAEGSSSPVPSYREYIEGRVPVFSTEKEVNRRLNLFSWSFVVGPAASGKTTLALRLAASPKRRGLPAYYLDLGEADVENGVVFAAVTRLSRRGTLLILDNVHRQPEFINVLWDLWRDLRRDDSMLVLLATRMDTAEFIAPQDDLTRLELHRENPAIPLETSGKDFGTIAQYLYGRMTKGRQLRAPPLPVLEQWREAFGGQLHAFCLAVLHSIPTLQRGDWTLSMDAAFHWVRINWLGKLDASSLANALCLSAFGAQDLELSVNKEALPYPESTEQLQRLGLSARTTHGAFGRYQRFSLVEPGWGTLILGAHSSSVDPENIIFDTAIPNPVMALELSARLRINGQAERRERLLATTAVRPEPLLSQVRGIDLHVFQNLVSEFQADYPKFANRLWEAIEREPDNLTARAWETPLGDLASFLSTAKRYERDVEPLWEAIEKAPDKLTARAWETPLHFLASFLDTAKRHKRDLRPLWEAIEGEPDKLTARIREAQLGDLRSFLDTAKQHLRDVGPLWKAIEVEPNRFAERAWATPLGDLGSFMDMAKGHERDVQPLWEAIEKAPEKLVARAWKTPLGHLASFLDTVKGHERDSGPLWEAIEGDPDKLTARAWDTPLGHLASFLDTVKGHERDSGPLWEAIEGDPDKFAARAWDTPLGDLGSFLDTARRHEREIAPLWEAIEGDPGKLAQTQWADLDKVAAWFSAVRRTGRDSQLYLRSFCQHPRKLSEFARDSKMFTLAGFVHGVPDELIRVAFADLTATQWDNISKSDRLYGAAWVAKKCKAIERDDLATALVMLLLRRANWRDFPPRQSMSLFLVAWLLQNVPPEGHELVPTFIDSICNRSWLGSHYTHVDKCGALAAGLYTLGLSQSPEVCRRFHNPSLGARLIGEIQKFDAAVPSQRSDTIRFLGAAVLCGWRLNKHTLAGVSPSLVGPLPEETLAHRPENDAIEDYQYQLWLGLRAFASIRQEPLLVRRQVIEDTFERWTNCLTLSTDDPESARHRIDQSMVVWLEKCLHHDKLGLLPESERLWELIGFPRYAS